VAQGVVFHLAPLLFVCTFLGGFSLFAFFGFVWDWVLDCVHVVVGGANLSFFLVVGGHVLFLLAFFLVVVYHLLGGGSSLKRRREGHRQVSSWLVLLSFLPNDCSAPKPDVVGSSPTAPVEVKEDGKVEFARFWQCLNLFCYNELLINFSNYYCVFASVFNLISSVMATDGR